MNYRTSSFNALLLLSSLFSWSCLIHSSLARQSVSTTGRSTSRGSSTGSGYYKDPGKLLAFQSRRPIVRRQRLADQRSNRIFATSKKENKGHEEVHDQSSNSITELLPLPKTNPKSKVPNHVAIICDGNSRWATERGLPKSMGHLMGANQLVNVLDSLKATEGVDYCTLYAFSTENWNRPALEIDELMTVLETSCLRFHSMLVAKHYRVKILGDLDDDRIPDSLKTAFRNLERETHAGTVVASSSSSSIQPFTVCFALNYGGRNDIVQASLKLAQMITKEELQPEDVTEDLFGSLLCTGSSGIGIGSSIDAIPLYKIPDPDLIIRTSGECRLSNFMLWNAAYAELYFTNVYWPDFNEAEWQLALNWYSKRQRNFGGRKGQ